MKYSELKKFFAANPEATEEDFNAHADGLMDWDFTRKKIETPEGMKALQSVFDRERTKAIQSYDEKTVPTKVEKLLAEKLAEREKEWKHQNNIIDDPMAQKIDKLQKQLDQRDAEIKRERLLSAAKSKMPSELQSFADRFLDEDEERTSLRVENLLEAYNQSVNKAVESTLKGGKTTPSRSEGVTGGARFTAAQIERMTPQERAQNNDALIAAYKNGEIQL